MGNLVLPKPNQIIPAILVNPRITIFYSDPKTGKTSLLLKLKDSLLIDLEDGSDYVEGTKVKANSLSEIVEIGRAIIADNFPYRHLIIDPVSKLVEWCEEEATIDYKKSTIGKNFKGVNVVQELPKGAGYYWLWKAYGRYFRYLASWAPSLILVAHVREKMLVDKEGRQVEATDLDLMGKLRQITCSKADAIGFMYRKVVGAENGKPIENIMISFRSADVTSGSRPRHLEGKEIPISKVVSSDEEIIADWSQVFLENQNGSK